MDQDANSETGTSVSRRSARSASAWSRISRNQTLRVYIQLPNGEKLLAPVPEIAKIQDLQAAALRRAASVGFDATLADTALRTSGQTRAILFGEDNVIDFVDMTSDDTFLLEYRPLTHSVTPASETTLEQASLSPRPFISSAPTLFASSQVYVRWITTADAVSAANLITIPVDPSPFHKDTTLDDLYKEGVARLCNSGRTSRCTDPKRLNLWLKECRLLAENNPVTLSDTGLLGSSDEPLDIFVEVVGLKERTSLSQVSTAITPQEAWDFNTSRRGICTFVTSLATLIKQVERNETQLNNVMEFLLRLKNFPPVVAAFQSVYNSGLRWNPDVGALLLIADLFSYVCEEMVPDWICPVGRKLEGSRQIMTWVNTCSVALSPGVQVPSFLRRVQFTPAVDETAQPSDPLFGNSLIVALPIGQPAVGQARGGTVPTRQVCVSVEEPKDGLAKTLGIALALSPTLFDRWDYYFEAPISWSELLSMPRLHRPGLSDFDNLLTEANMPNAFRMVDPMNLGACTSAELPVITLSAKGYVSAYDQMDIDCGEREFYLWNPIETQVTFKNTDLGQYISRQLDDIIAERKNSDSWEVDAWSNWSTRATHGDPEESIVVCVDRSDSMSNMMPSSWYAAGSSGTSSSRLMEVKEFFKHFSTRLSSYSIRVHTGLVAFNNVVTVVQPLDDNQLNFREKLDQIRPCNGTAIFGALDTAKQMLVSQKKAYPNTKLRILLLTDGKDNASIITASAVSAELYKHNIVLDSIVIGSDHVSELFKVCRQTGGYAFNPDTQHVFFQIFLLETMVDIRTRPDIVKIHVDKWWQFSPKSPDMKDSFDFPPCRPHANQNDYFISLGDASKFLGRMSTYTPAHSLSSASSTTSTATTVTSDRVVLNEVYAMIRNQHPEMDVYISDSNMRFWKVVIQGPRDSPYQYGTFLLFVDIVPEFPRLPPAVRFITPMLHPNISKHGRVCHPVFDREWDPNIHVFQVLQQIYGLLMFLEPRDAIDPISILKFYTDREAGEHLVQLYVSRFASKSRERLRADILGDDTSTIASETSTSSSASGQTLTPSNPGMPSQPNHQGSAPNSTITAPLGLSRLQRHLVLQRNPAMAARPPPLVISATDNPLASTGSVPLSVANEQALSQNRPVRQSQEGLGTDGSERPARSRRESFFARLRRPGSSS